MRAVDTNVLVRLVAHDDPSQVASANLFIAPGAWVSILALVEAVWVLGTVYDRSPGELRAAIEGLLAHDKLTIQEPDVVIAALDLFHARPKLGFSDCLMLELARKAGHLPLGTFDRALAMANGAQKL